MLSYRDSKMTKIILIVFFVIVIIYAYFEIRGILYGPHIEIAATSGTVRERYVVISGRSQRISSLSVDGAPIAVTTDGSFEVPYLLAPGINHILFDAKDSYGNTSSKVVQIVYIPDPSVESGVMGTSTAARTTATSTQLTPTENQKAPSSPASSTPTFTSPTPTTSTSSSQ